MSDWNYRWVCPHWEFLHYQEDAPDIPFAERSRESASTFLNLMNPLTHNVDVRVEFFDSQGNVDIRFGLEGIISGRAVWRYRVDTGGPNFPKPPAGVMVTAQGWFRVLASHRLFLSAHVTASKYTHHARAWGFAVPVYEWKLPVFVAGFEEPFAGRMSENASEFAQTLDALRGADVGTGPAPSGPPRVDARGLILYEPELEDAREERRHKDGTPPDRQG